MKYNWQEAWWPNFRYSLKGMEEVFRSFQEKTGYIAGLIQGIPDNLQQEAILDFMISEAIKTSEIEGEYLSRKDVASSLKNNLGLHQEKIPVGDKRAEGAARLMIDIRETYQESITKEVLFNWHRLIMMGSNLLEVGKWRTHADPVQVVSGAMGKEKIHFEAPPSEKVPEEMAYFIDWFNRTSPWGTHPIEHPVVRSAIAHLFFESIHPFEDGNGRIGRAISEKALSQGIGRPILFSISRAIEGKKKAYYQNLEEAQRANETTSWISYFIHMVLEAQDQAAEQIEFTLKKTKFFDRFRAVLTDRESKVVRRMFREGPDGFEGGMNARKYIGITKVSKATATRDLQKLVEKGVFKIKGGGRSTRYELNL